MIQDHFTPAPWDYAPLEADPRSIAVCQEKRGIICLIPAPVAGEPSGFSRTEDKANARLIALSPMLLRALRDLVSEIDSGRTDWKTSAGLLYARAVIDLARHRSWALVRRAGAGPSAVAGNPVSQDVAAEIRARCRLKSASTPPENALRSGSASC